MAQNSRFGRGRQQRTFDTPPPVQQPTKKLDKAEVIAYAEERATLYSDKYNFDAFQKEVLKKFLGNYYAQKFDVAYDDALKYDDKLSLISTYENSFQKELETFLTPEQARLIMEEEQHDGKSFKKKKDKKNKKKKNKKG